MPPTSLVAIPSEAVCHEWQYGLQTLGCEAVTAETAGLVLSVAPRLQPELIILSESLPDIPGPEVCRRLKTNPYCRLTPVVIRGAWSGVGSRARAFDAGADDFVEYSQPAREWIPQLMALLSLKAHVDQRTAAALYSLAECVDKWKPDGKGHGTRVSGNSVSLGKSLGFNETELEDLRIGGLLHDIGKVNVPQNILDKPGPLSSEELRVIQNHTVLGEQLCAPLKLFRRVLPIIRHHHERLDGSGYPDALQGSSISPAVRVLQIADIFDALISNRPYRRGLPLPAALMKLFDEVERGRLDRVLVAQFSTLMIRSNSVQMSCEKNVRTGSD